MKNPKIVVGDDSKRLKKAEKETKKSKVQTSLSLLSGVDIMTMKDKELKGLVALICEELGLATDGIIN